MFLIQDENRLPLQSAVAGEGAGVWAVMEQWTPGDLLVLRVSEKRSRGVPCVIWMDLTSGAASLDQFLDGGNVLRGAAVVSTRRGRPVEDWYLDPLSEIRVGATEISADDRTLLTVTQFTTVAGRKFSVAHGFATRYARGRRIWQARRSHSGPMQ
ncbi:hypothetical protein PI86_09160 [Burkholderia sp. A9]|uniref:hypothetical protein n=1 Tax=Burkholderia sp. A9 TaxID=1365108 RepID=UPI000573525F|nr:hypothetical protein [Burkholderia sp. A9]KHK59481.1 hypothetical protein PI86_09160 [Burkholderia sp. A9]